MEEVQSALPWFKLVVNKDGSVASVERIEGAHDERGRSVHYLQAASKEEAIKIWAARWRTENDRRNRRKEVKTAHRKAHGLCVECGLKAEKGTLCLAHWEKRQESLLAHRARKRGLPNAPALKIRPRAITDEERAASALRYTESKDQAKTKGINHYRLAKLKCYTACLEAFESMSPSVFRGWLIARALEQRDHLYTKDFLAKQALAIPRKKSTARVDVTARKAG